MNVALCLFELVSALGQNPRASFSGPPLLSQCLFLTPLISLWGIRIALMRTTGFLFRILRKCHPLVVHCNQLLRCVFVHVIRKEWHTFTGAAHVQLSNDRNGAATTARKSCTHKDTACARVSGYCARPKSFRTAPETEKSKFFGLDAEKTQRRQASISPKIEQCFSKASKTEEWTHILDVLRLSRALEALICFFFFKLHWSSTGPFRRPGTCRGVRCDSLRLSKF